MSFDGELFQFWKQFKRNAPGSKPGRLASEDARAAATHPPKRTFPGIWSPEPREPCFFCATDAKQTCRARNCGDRVRINRGPLADKMAKISRIEPDGRIRVLIDMMGRKQPLKLRREDVDAA